MDCSRCWHWKPDSPELRYCMATQGNTAVKEWQLGYLLPAAMAPEFYRVDSAQCPGFDLIHPKDLVGFEFPVLDD